MYFLGVRRSCVVDGITYGPCLQLYTNRKFGIHHRLSSNAVELLKQEKIFHVLVCTSFPFVDGYSVARATLEFDWSVVDGLDRGVYTYETGEVHMIDARE